jgi:hypothetical protein
MGAIVSLLLALVLLGGGGATYASADSLPGEALYPMKQAAERFRLVVTQDDVTRGQLHMSFADERLEEAIVLADEDPGHVSQCLMAYAGEMEQAMAILAPQAEGDQALATALQERLAFQQRLLAQVPDTGDEGVQERLRATMQLTNRIRVKDDQEEPASQEQQGAQENEGLEQRQRTQEQERIQTNQAITATQTVSEAQRIQERQRVEVRNEISGTETISEPLKLQNQERTRLQEQDQNQEQPQDQAQEPQQDQSQERDQGEGSVQDQNQQQNQEPEGTGSSNGGKR